MKKSNFNFRTFYIFILIISLTITKSFSQDKTSSFWTEQNVKKLKNKNKKTTLPTSFKAFTIDGEKMKNYLHNSPSKKENTKNYLLDLPLPNGTWETFSICTNSLMSKELAAKYPNITTYDAEGKTSNLWSGKLDFTTSGFHALLTNGNEQIFIQPIKEGDLINYIVFYKKDAIKKGKYIYESNTQAK